MRAQPVKLPREGGGGWMFIGHWAPALAAAAIAKREPRLGALFVAGQLVDWAFDIFLLGGVEHLRLVPGLTAMNNLDLYDLPYTHSLLGCALFAAAFATAIWLWRRDIGYALLAGAVALSHWVLDLVAHRPDLTLAGAPPKLGFGLWDHPAIEMPLELALTYGALWFYLSRTRGPALPAIALAAVMAVLQAINWFGKQPTEVDAATGAVPLVAYALTTIVAWWLGMTRTRVRRRG